MMAMVMLDVVGFNMTWIHLRGQLVDITVVKVDEANASIDVRFDIVFVVILGVVDRLKIGHTRLCVCVFVQVPVIVWYVVIIEM